ncbi:hypothetical protein NDU88_002550 [Pleurodeles waltl]|uniref:Uncharacterized protein n=1 Tax=Pleurodeles waltl TaxID=8319 RepID=A0AAV7Q961_PLEWA|nr:hypothetical protein NDU88_002550 [Pleurodeles waltl]
MPNRRAHVSPADTDRAGTTRQDSGNADAGSDGAEVSDDDYVSAMKALEGNYSKKDSGNADAGSDGAEVSDDDYVSAMKALEGNYSKK